MGATPQESQQIIDNTAAIKAIQDGAKKVSQLPTLTSLVNSQDKIPLERADTGQTVYTTIEQLKDGGVGSNTVKHPIALSFSSDKIEKGALRNMFGGLDKVVDADTLSTGNDIVASGGRSKLMFVVNAGTDVVGDLKITGTKVDRDTGVSTPGFEEIISIDSLSIDNSTTDTFGNIVHDFSNCYTSTEWFTNGFTISTTDLDISDIDIYNVAFNQFGDMEEVTIDALDLTAITTNANAEISGHAYTVRVANGKTTIETFANMELPAIDFNAGFYRFRNAVNEVIDTRTDGVFVDINFMPFIQSYFENMSFILWAHENETINIVVDGSLGLDSVIYGENLTNGTLVYLNADGKYYKADNTAESTSTTELRLILEDGLLDDEKLALSKGQYTTTSLTAGLEYVGTNGTITNSRPTLETETVRIVSTAINATTRYFDASKTWINGTASKINGVTIAGAGTEFLDNIFKILNSTDQTKKLEFDLSGISSSETRVASLQDKDGVIAYLDDISASFGSSGTSSSNTLLFTNAVAGIIHGTWDIPIVGDLTIDLTDSVEGGCVAVIWSGSVNPIITGGTIQSLSGEITEQGIYTIYFHYLRGRFNVNIFNTVTPIPSEFDLTLNLIDMLKTNTIYTTTTEGAWLGRGLANEVLTGDGYVFSDVLSTGSDGNGMLKLSDTNANDIYTDNGGVVVFALNGVYYTIIIGESGVSSGINTQVGDKMRLIRDGINLKAEYERAGVWNLIRDFGDSTDVATGNAYSQIFANRVSTSSAVNNPKIFK